MYLQEEQYSKLLVMSTVCHCTQDELSTVITIYTQHGRVCCRNKTKQRKEEDIPLEYMNPQDNDDGVNSIQRKTPIPREGFCEYVKNMHKSKNKHFITEFSVRVTTMHYECYNHTCHFWSTKCSHQCQIDCNYKPLLSHCID